MLKIRIEIEYDDDSTEIIQLLDPIHCPGVHYWIPSTHAGYCFHANIIIMIHDVTNRETFENIQEWNTFIDSFGCTEELVKVLVENKIDLIGNEIDSMDVVSTTEGETMAKLNWMYHAFSKYLQRLDGMLYV